MAEQDLLFDSKTPLVSIIIPCYNAERWLAEAIDSALAQTYPNIEIITVDDGSSDDSRNVMERYRGRIRIEYRPHINGNAARNHGFRVSSGEYIQFLDADDYITPHKIQTQVSHAITSQADIVYGTYKYQYHASDGGISFSPEMGLLPDGDIRELLLTGWTISNCAAIWSRDAIKRSDGWDEDLPAAQDVDFLLSVVFAGASVSYRPGCNFIYRRYGAMTLSTANKKRHHDATRRVIDKWKKHLEDAGQLCNRYREALAQWYLQLARLYRPYDFESFQSIIREIPVLAPNYVPTGSRIYTSALRIGGWEFAEEIMRLRICILTRHIRLMDE